jgi:hypothetical protein
MLRIFTHTVVVPGTLAADVDFRFTLPCDAQLLHISASNSSANAAGLTVGNSSAAAAYLAKSSIGVSGTPVEFDQGEFVGAQFPRIAKGTIFVAAVDYDYNGGGSGAASANLSLVFTFSEG